MQFLKKHRLRLGGIVYHRHVIPINVSWSRNFNAHNLKLIPDAVQRLNVLFHGNKLSPKNSALNSGLFLGMPIHYGNIHKYNITGTGKTICLIPGILRIDKHSKLNFLTDMFRRIMRLCLFGIYVEGSPVIV